MINERLIEKVRKLLNLSESGNEHEARLAAERANEILLRYNLSMQDAKAPLDYIEKHLEETPLAPQEEKFILPILREFFFVRFLTQKRKEGYKGCYRYSRHLIIVGEPTNVEVASYTYEFLIRAFRSAWKDHQKKTGDKVRVRPAYYMGLEEGIIAQLRAKTVKVQEETGLVLLPDAGLKRYIDAKNLKTGKAAAPIRFDAGAAAAGFRDGKDLNILKGIRADQNAQASGRMLGSGG